MKLKQSAPVQNRNGLSGLAKRTRDCCPFIITLALLSCHKEPVSKPESRHSSNIPGNIDGKDNAKTKAVSLTIENLAIGLFALRSSGSTRIATLAIIERRDDDGRWIPYEGLDGANGYRIVDKCPESSDTGPTCREIKAGEIVVPVSWNGQLCSAQCAPACTAESYRAGPHRLVVRDCDNDKMRYEGPVFEMPKSAAITARWQVASLAERGTIYRLDPMNHEDSLKSRMPDRIVGFAIRPTAPIDLSKDILFDLSQWLKKTTVDDEVVDRCLWGLTIGIVVLHTLPNGAEGRSELALDFRCNRLLIVRDQGGQRRITSTSFNSLKPEILAIMRRALPKDKDLMRVK
jgi:hypothetical protein